MEFLKWRLESKTAIITINRPPANALSNSLLHELDGLLSELENNTDVRVIVLHGEGRFFSAGADIKEFTVVQSGEQFSKLARDGQQLFEKMERFPKPIIASIHGAALGGALELAMSCHIRLVSETAKLGLPELQLGIIPGFAGTQRLPKYVGTAKAAEMMFTSEPISGLEAVQWGLATRAFPEEVLMEQTMKLAKKIEKKSPVSLKAVIKLLNYSKSAQFYQGVENEATMFGEVFDTNDAKEGIQAFIEKREPNFTGQ
ncbi:enoyl-CoA hydratase [Caldibacillus lycopersici]|uniref:Enoyl-CoA hydratase n=1 Tax=Perspicuibacillus lycopersici TaxID=1325689 RepID=A0AAE3LNS2_9BACI|nr:enoyl-CoA hydratase [Perspicuibacillus lycopersici]MCU9614142.1 enoyl-CoA hydratase [Perspicuibacillus lycopersici]